MAMHHCEAFNKQTNLKESYGSNAYMLWVLGLYLDEPDLDALAGRSLTDGGNDKCLDFIEIDKTGQKIVIAQGYFSEKQADKAPAKKASDLMIAASWLAHGDERARTLNEKVRTRSIECREALEAEEIEQIELLYIHNLPESLNSREELATCAAAAKALFESYQVDVTCKELGLEEIETLFRERHSQILVKEQIEIDGNYLGNHLTEDWEAHVYTVTGNWLRDLFKRYDDKLFSANYRGFLGINKRKTINSAIKNTAEKQAADFWVYNNGITLLTNQFTKQKTPKHKATLSGISIINGAQTTGSIGGIDSATDLSDVQIMCRIVISKNPDKINEIVKFNNTQNKITTWDRYANDELQGVIRSQFRDLNIEYSIKRGFESVDAAIGIEKAAQPVLAFNGHYIDANRGKNSIFDRPELYKKTFSEKTAGHILLAYCFAKSIDMVRFAIERKNSKTENEKEQLELFNFLSFRYFLLACIGASLQQFIGGAFSPSDAKFNKKAASENSVNDLAVRLQKITRQVLRATAKSLKNKANAEKTTTAKLLRDDSTLSSIAGDLNSFLESVLDGELDQEHQSLIFVER